MSYQASFSTRINTRIASNALKNIGRNIIQMAEGIRVGSEKCTASMDALMNKKNGFLVNMTELKTEFQNCYSYILKEEPALSAAQAKLKAINEIPELKKFVELTTNYYAVTFHQELLVGKEGKTKVEDLINESFALIEKSVIDIQTVLVTKAITECKWKIIDSASDSSTQTIVAQNAEGNVVGLNITGENIDFDISGFCDSTCVDHAKTLFKKLDEMGLKSNLVSGFKHNKPSGGMLLSESKDAKKIIKKAKNKIRKAVRISIPIKTSRPNSSDAIKNKTHQKLKEV